MPIQPRDELRYFTHGSDVGCDVEGVGEQKQSERLAVPS